MAYGHPKCRRRFRTAKLCISENGLARLPSLDKYPFRERRQLGMIAGNQDYRGVEQGRQQAHIRARTPFVHGQNIRRF